ncbi:hypothetical protein JG688_00017868 [Phytophthora aleatoria]|uniref:Uncharacterized protein n=1 Tax=Phytophthora aleatoria TaxID=2496075 RepID=A0A8J5IQ86_9STRA|nr:hypothetical protein JG688_00017868 [Phytophthora aleatoria]
MSIRSFTHLLDLISPRLEVDERQSSTSSGEEPISPCIILMATLRYLVGGSDLDIRRTVGTSSLSYYRVVDSTMAANISVPKLRIRFPDSEKEVVMADFRDISLMVRCAKSSFHQLKTLVTSVFQWPLLPLWY